MADEPSDDNTAQLLGEAAWATAMDAAAEHPLVTRQPERRVADRRATPRRQDDADDNQRTRAVVLDYLRQLPAEHLWRWIDDLLVGRASEAQLAVLLEAVRSDDERSER